jgi:hypothetical protein
MYDDICRVPEYFLQHLPENAARPLVVHDIDPLHACVLILLRLATSMCE